MACVYQCAGNRLFRRRRQLNAESRLDEQVGSYLAERPGRRSTAGFAKKSPKSSPCLPSAANFSNNCRAPRRAGLHFSGALSRLGSMSLIALYSTPGRNGRRCRFLTFAQESLATTRWPYTAPTQDGKNATVTRGLRTKLGGVDK